MSTPAVEPCHDDDAALARSLQLVADSEFAELAIKRMFGTPTKALRSKVPRNSRSNGRVEQSSTVPREIVVRPRRNRRRSPPQDAPEKDEEISPSPSLEIVWSDGSSLEETNKHLLHVPCLINGRCAEMMVDTGAQTSVLSSTLMNKLGLARMLDTRKAGVATGVGTARILGRIEKCPIQIGHAEFRLYFSVLETDEDLMILGIDQMRRFNCLVDLEDNKLIFGGKGGVEVECFRSH